MQRLSIESISVDEIRLPVFTEKNVRAAVLRLDKIHPIISGNKWFKLKYYLEDAKLENKQELLTLGGAYSNHIVATAAAGRIFGYQTIGVIRGEEPSHYSQTLSQAKEEGMKLIFLSREDFKAKNLLVSRGVYVIDEGGYGLLGAKGAAEILQYCKLSEYSHICCAVGTTTMMAGLVKGSLAGQMVVGVSTLKNNRGLEQQLENLLTEEERSKRFRIIHDYHFGGYAKKNRVLIDFMNGFYRLTAIPTDFVYTAKLVFGIHDLVSKDFFEPGSNILIIHSGGLQGNSSLPEGMLIF